MNQQSGGGQSSQPTQVAQYQSNLRSLSPEAQQLMKECRQQAFVRRGAPFAIGNMVIYTLMERGGYIKATSPLMYAVRTAGLGLFGLITGRMSYVGECKRMFEQAGLLHELQTLNPYQQGQVQTQPSVGGLRPTDEYLSPDQSQSTEEQEEGRQTAPAALSYDQLRQRHRQHGVAAQPRIPAASPPPLARRKPLDVDAEYKALFGEQEQQAPVPGMGSKFGDSGFST